MSFRRKNIIIAAKAGSIQLCIVAMRLKPSKGFASAWLKLYKTNILRATFLLFIPDQLIKTFTLETPNQK
jgi:hypothetical protein